MRVLFLDEVHPVLREMLEAKGIECEEELKAGKEGLKDRIGDYEGLVIRSRVPMDRELLGYAERLRFIARSGAGMENIDEGYCRERGIALFNAPEGNRDAVGEHALGMLLSLFNKLCKGDREVRKGEWKREENRGIELGERTVGIIGYGNTASAFARKLQGFGCRTLAYDKYRRIPDGEPVEEVPLEVLQREADVLSFHVPLTEETRYYFDGSFLERMRDPFYLLNTSRGPVVSTEAVVEGLRSGKLLGACLDVLEHEKASLEALEEEVKDGAFRELLKDERVLLSPHVAGWTDASYRRLSEVLGRKVLEAFG